MGILTIYDNENTALSETGKRIKLSTSLTENIQNWKWIINSINQSLENLPAIKAEYSEEIKKISKKAGIWEWIKNVIQLYTLLNQSPDWNSFLAKNKDFVDSELFDYNNPIILIWMIWWLAKQNMKQSYKINIFWEYLNHATEENIFELLKNLEKIDKDWIIFNLFTKELVLFTIRFLQANITIKENTTIQKEFSENFYHQNQPDDFDYWTGFASAWDFVDLESFENFYDDNDWDFTLETTDVISEQLTYWEDLLNNNELEDIFEWIERGSPLYILLTVIKENYNELFINIIIDLRNHTESPIYGYKTKDIQKTITWKSSLELFNLLKYLIWDKEIETVKKQVIDELFKNWEFTNEAKEAVLLLLEHETNEESDDIDLENIVL